MPAYKKSSVQEPLLAEETSLNTSWGIGEDDLVNLKNSTLHAQKPSSTPISTNSALTLNTDPSTSSEEEQIYEVDDLETVDHEFVKEERRIMCSIGLPVAMSYLFRAGLLFTDISILGQISSDYLAGAALANVWMMMTAIFVERGISSAVGVVCSQAKGANNPTLMGLYLQQGVFWTVLMALPVILLWIYTEDMLTLLGITDKEHILTLAGIFSRWSTFALIPRLLANVISRWLQVSGNVIAAMSISGVCMLLNIAVNYFFVHGISMKGMEWEGFGYKGSPIATSLVQTLMLVMFVAYINFKKGGIAQFGWAGWDLKAALSKQRVKIFLLGQAIPLGIGGVLEDWQLEVVAVFAAKLGSVELATHNATLSVYFLVTSLMFGLITAASVRVGFHLGAGRPCRARKVGYIALIAAMVIGIAVGSAFFFGRSLIARVFSNEKEVWEESERIQGFVGLTYIFLAFFYAALSSLNGQGRPVVVAICFGVGAWIFGVPMSYFFAFTMDFKLLGLWFGLGAGYLFTTISTGIVAIRSDWSALSVAAMKRAEANKKILVQLYGVEVEDVVNGEGDGDANLPENVGTYDAKDSNSLTQSLLTDHDQDHDHDTVHSSQSQNISLLDGAHALSLPSTTTVAPTTRTHTSATLSPSSSTESLKDSSSIVFDLSNNPSSNFDFNEMESGLLLSTASDDQDQDQDQDQAQDEVQGKTKPLVTTSSSENIPTHVSLGTYHVPAQQVHLPADDSILKISPVESPTESQDFSVNLNMNLSMSMSMSASSNVLDSGEGSLQQSPSDSPKTGSPSKHTLGLDMVPSKSLSDSDSFSTFVFQHREMDRGTNVHTSTKASCAPVLDESAETHVDSSHSQVSFNRSSEANTTANTLTVVNFPDQSLPFGEDMALSSGESFFQTQDTDVTTDSMSSATLLSTKRAPTASDTDQRLPRSSLPEISGSGFRLTPYSSAQAPAQTPAQGLGIEKEDLSQATQPLSDLSQSSSATSKKTKKKGRKN